MTTVTGFPRVEEYISACKLLWYRSIGIHQEWGASMIAELEQELMGVVCLYCGLHTPLPVSKARLECTDSLGVSNAALSIVRCHSCGKEAPYLAGEYVVIKEGRKGLRFAA